MRSVDSSRWPVWAARVRMPLTALAMIALFVGLFAPVPGWWPLVSLPLFALAGALYVRLGTPRGPALDLASPVRGRWQAVNSPSSRVPSHHIHAWSQTYAIDLVADPADGSRPSASWWPLARRPADFPGFGRTLHAPVDGDVVRAHGWLRDHWSRTSPLALVYLMIEGVRELAGPVGVLGNHVVIRSDDGAYVLLAHLQRGSLTVARGDRVGVGDVVARCGNSGNSTEPHVHVQVMDRPSVWIAAGRPMRIAGSPPPPDGEHLDTGSTGEAAPAAATPSAVQAPSPGPTSVR